MTSYQKSNYIFFHLILPSWPFLAFIALILAVGCQKEKFQIDQKFVNLYVDLRLATIGNPRDANRAAETRRIILAQYEVQPEEFTAYLKKIEKRPEVWVEFQNKVLERLKQAEKTHKGE